MPVSNRLGLENFLNACSDEKFHKLTLWPTAHCCHTGTAPVSDRVMPSFEFLTSRHSDTEPWAPECLDVKNYKWRLNPVWHRMRYSCTHMATVGVKGLTAQNSKINTRRRQTCCGVVLPWVGKPRCQSLQESEGKRRGKRGGWKTSERHGTNCYAASQRLDSNSWTTSQQSPTHLIPTMNISMERIISITQLLTRQSRKS